MGVNVNVEHIGISASITASIKSRLLFSCAGYASCGLSLSSVNSVI